MFTLWLSINTMSLAFGLWIGGGFHSPAVHHPWVCRGNVNCWVGPARASATFDVHTSGSTPAGGVFHYRDVTPTGMTRVFRLAVTRVAVNGDDGVFVGRVDSSNIPGWRDRWVKVWVRDRATPGSGGDQVTFRFCSAGAGSQSAWLLTPLVYFPVTGGDLTIER